MDLQIITTMISSVGFPIVACIALGFFIYRLFQDAKGREEKLITAISDTNNINRELTKTNAEFVKVLDAYSADLDHIKCDVTEIKQTMLKGN